MANYVNTVSRDVLSVKDFGAVGDGVADDTAAFNALTAHLRANYVDTADYDYAGIQLLIPPGKYSISSWDLTSLFIQNVHVVGHGAVLIARTANKHVIDAIGSRYLKFHGLTVYSASGVVAKSGLQVGPVGTEACGNVALNDLTIIGYYASAPYMNLGSETTTLDNVRLIQRNTDTAAYAQICDGLSTYLPTSDYATVTRSGGTAISFTANNYHGCQLRNEGGGSASYLGATVGWEFDLNCYHLSFNDSAFVVHGTSTIRPGKLIIKGSFESSQNDQPTGGNIGLRYAVTFTNDGTNTAIDGFTFESSNMHAETFVFRNTGAGTLRLSDADLRVHYIEQSGCLMFGTSGSISVDGILMCQYSSKINFGVLTAFNGIANVDAYSALGSIPAAGSYTIYSRGDATRYNGGTLQLNSAPFSFTPVVTFATPGDLSVSYSFQNAVGYRIGKLVFFSLSLTFTPTYTTASGEFRISGLPYTSANNQNQEPALGVSNINSAWTWPTSVTQLSGRLPNNSQLIRLYGHGSTIASTVFTTAHVPTGTAKSLIISGSYLSA